MAYLTVEEVAKRYRLSQNTIRNLAKKGKIKARKIGKNWRFDESDIDFHARS